MKVTAVPDPDTWQTPMAFIDYNGVHHVFVMVSSILLDSIALQFVQGVYGGRSNLVRLTAPHWRPLGRMRR